MLFVLVSCSDDKPIVSLTPELKCPAAIKCHIYEWRIGLRVAGFVSGSHIDCKCVSAGDAGS